MFMHVWKEKGRKVFLSLMAFAFLLVGGIWYAKEYTTVGNSVNGREMPVCSVETEEKEMALTFETAWGEERTGDILDLLKKEGGDAWRQSRRSFPEDRGGTEKRA